VDGVLRLLPALVLCAAPAAVLAQNDEGLANVALGKTYTCSSPGGIAWRGLLDGEVDSDAPPACFATGNDAEYPKKIVIDLGAVHEVSQVAVHSSANGNTKKVDVWVSKDGVNYAQVRAPYIFPKGAAQRMSAKFPATAARYVKLALWDTWTGGLGGDNVLFLREVEVFGKPTPVTAGTRARPEIPHAAPRAARLLRHYVLQEDHDLRLLVIGDEMAAERHGAPGLARMLATALKERFHLGSVDAADLAKPGMTARSARAASLSALEDSPDLVVVALGMADSLAFDPADFRSAAEKLLTTIMDDTEAFVVVVVPPRIPHSASLGRADECTTADTADPAWQLASIVAGTEMGIIDADAVLEESGLPVESAYADNLSLTSAGLEALAATIISLFTTA
jgi:F5/8 type C domain